jgi:hypothetical protein
MSLQNSRLKEYYNLERAQDKYINKKRKITSIILKKLRLFFLSFFLFFLLILIYSSKSKRYKIAKVTIDKCHLEITPTVDNHQGLGLITKGAR